MNTSLSIHDPKRVIPGRQVLVRMAAAVATLGSGGSLGLEGPRCCSGQEPRMV